MRKKVFQFPTGWNSTLPNPQACKSYDSFNSQRDGILQFVDLRRSWNSLRFNSQRDGILHYQSIWSLKLYVVSIPNGMEFYYMEVYHYARVHKFQFPTGWNSTSKAVNPSHILMFQFPTGWNSTKRAYQSQQRNTVSIPNGMEFYRASFTTAQISIGFNSQRDGILLKIKLSRTFTHTMFQFPTGWNSTPNPR